ncbi:DUF3068 domain-containing protein [Micromonospora sp. C28SCA-DRY-2]|uniref:DUF3068 domain-containing protein n=1 Tax=Micromonospora sp. C28SCA-DRY-2 TaxID=3059522 RepID=UPI0026750A0E|nr:DUF3068 domain-containing protein [Micromonospora sp. C28SCA-DRY-2]MDO3703578.1 DUF3068 domain-containing protein [Micromonospora sp. C28SCA-DRY-2]
MKARLGAVLFGIGVLCLVLAAGAAFFVAPTVTKLPYDLALCNAEGEPDGCLKPSVAVAENAKFLQLKKDAPPTVQSGTLEATTEVAPQAGVTEAEMTGDLEGDAVVWAVYGTVKWTQTSEVISQYSAELALDRETAAAVDWDKQFLQADGPEGPAEVNFAGQTYKFPFNTERKDYEYFDRDLRKALPIRFDGTEEINGTEAYRFQQVIEETDLGMPADRVSGLLGAFAPEATSGKVVYSNTRTIWVEPVSGNFVKVQEQQKKMLVPDQGLATTLLDANFVYTDDTIANSVKSAGETSDKLKLIGRTIPLALAVVGALALIVGLWLVLTGRRAAAARHRVGDSDDTSAAGRETPAEQQEITSGAATRGQGEPERR